MDDGEEEEEKIIRTEEKKRKKRKKKKRKGKQAEHSRDQQGQGEGRGSRVENWSFSLHRTFHSTSSFPWLISHQSPRYTKDLGPLLLIRLTTRNGQQQESSLPNGRQN